MKHSLILVITVLLFASVANAQTEKEKREFVEACLAGVIKTGCPTPNNQPLGITTPPLVSVEDIKARNLEAQKHADDEAAKARVASTSPQSLTPAPTPVVSAAPPVPAQSTEVVQTAPKGPIAPRHVLITPIGQHTAAQCGPAKAPPGAGAMYGINRARCLRTAK